MDKNIIYEMLNDIEDVLLENLCLGDVLDIITQFEEIMINHKYRSEGNE